MHHSTYPHKVKIFSIITMRRPPILMFVIPRQKFEFFSVLNPFVGFLHVRKAYNVLKKFYIQRYSQNVFTILQLT